MLQGKDVQGIAEPGSGKTLAYLLPGIVRLAAAGHGAASPPPPGPLMLILAPTRELAAQVAAQARLVRASSGLRSALVYGGVDKGPQVGGISGKELCALFLDFWVLFEHTSWCIAWLGDV